MRTDRELLELAAKAAGLQIEFDPKAGFHWLGSKYSTVMWNPLHRVEDAFRLLVALRMTLICARDHNACDVPGTDEWAMVNGVDSASACRAIVIAAAEIGAAM